MIKDNYAIDICIKFLTWCNPNFLMYLEAHEVVKTRWRNGIMFIVDPKIYTKYLIVIESLI